MNLHPVATWSRGTSRAAQLLISTAKTVNQS